MEPPNNNVKTSATENIGVLLSGGANSWEVWCDSTKKENLLPINGEAILRKISTFNLCTWNYKGQDPEKYRHYGPMAQDFFAAFGHDGIGVCGDDTTISGGDFDGINFTAIHALEKRTTELRNEISELRTENQMLKEEVIQLKRKLLVILEEIAATKEQSNAR